MSVWMQMVAYSLVAVFTQNMVFSMGIGVDRAIQISKSPKMILSGSAMVALFSLIGLSGGLVGEKLIEVWPWAVSVRFIVPIVFLCVGYGVLLWLSSLIYKPLFVYFKELLPGCAFNSMVMLLGVGSRFYIRNFSRMFGFSVGTGIGFFVATWLILDGSRRIVNQHMNREFRGTPSLMIYIGILTMVFLGFTGGGESLL